MLTNKDKHFMGIKDIFCLLMLGVCPSERFLDPPPFNFVHDQIRIYLALFRVRLRHFLGRALRLGCARGLSTAARKD